MRSKLRKLIFSRFFVVAILILVQFLILFVTSVQFSRYFVYYYLFAAAVSLVVVLRVVSSKRNMAYKLAWSVIILVFPAFGAAIYLIFCGNRLSRHALSRMRFMEDVMRRELGADESRQNDADVVSLRQMQYIETASGCPPCENVDTRYFSSGEALFPVLCDELRKAEKYIFLEYFIISEGEMWDRIHEILLDKVRCGVDVRLIYDDIGCIMSLKRDFAKKLEKEGIKCRVFHRFIPLLSSRQNNRDHRKICVIDGTCAFTGGVNLADEYINRVERFGYWKDNAILMRGPAAWSFSVMFLTMWDYLNGERDSAGYAAFRPAEQNTQAEPGIVQPYADNPLDNEPVGENVYLGMLSSAERYVWITTPYLIIDEQMERALCRAVKSGIDVRIVTPGIPDKRIVKETTKAFYPELIRNGVKIYEYDPGFIHAKTFLCDDRYAAVGSVNLDYRSLYLHFECGVWMTDVPCITDMKADFEDIFDHAHLVTEEKTGLLRMIFRGVLELIAPLL